MKRKDIVMGQITRMDFPNIGILSYEDKEVQVKLALPGQTVSAQIQKARGNRPKARLLEIIEESPLATETDICPHFGRCGGCLYGGFSYANELAVKHEQIRRIFVPVWGQDVVDTIDEGIVESPLSEGYRNKMEFSFGDSFKDGPLALGMHKRGSFFDIETVASCRLIDNDMRAVLTRTLSYFSDKQITFYHRIRHEGYLRHLLVRKAMHTGELLVCLVTNDMPVEKDLLEGFARELLAQSYEGKLVGILHTKNARAADVIEDQGTAVLYGRDYFTERLGELSFTITPFSFFQTNTKGAEVLYDTVKDFLPCKDGVLYDLYSGTGTIAQILSSRVKECIGVEIVPEAVVAAKENAKRNHLTNCTFIADDVLKALDEIRELPDMIVLDPPREGVHPKALSKILSFGVEHIVYISCKASSLARDAQMFSEASYEPVRLKTIDMFPHTGNVEVICLFSKKSI